MSARDTRLLELAGLSAAEAALLLGRSRAALYQGISIADRHYLSSLEALFIVQSLKKRDSPQSEAVNRFIEESFADDGRDIILSDHVTIDQLNRAAATATKVLLLLNGSMVHLERGSFVMQFLDNLTRHPQVSVTIGAPAYWVFDVVRAAHEITAKCEVRDELRFLPCCAGLRSKGRPRMFVFGKSATEEIPLPDAEKIWERFASEDGANEAEIRRAAPRRASGASRHEV